MQVREILVIGSSLLLIAKDLVGGSDDLYLLARRRLTAVKIGMVLLDRRAERPREGLNVCAGVGAQQIVERLLRCAAGPGVPTTDPVTLAELQAHSRRKLLDRVVAEKMLVCGSHFPWPGLGRFAKDGGGYALEVQPA